MSRHCPLANATCAQPLPRVNPFNIATHPTSHRAYVAREEFEAAAADAGDDLMAGDINSIVLQVARVCGYMLIYFATTPTALANLINEVVDAYDKDLKAMAYLGLRYVNAFIMGCKWTNLFGCIGNSASNAYVLILHSQAKKRYYTSTL